MGHGNSAVIDGGGAISVIDGGNSDTLMLFLTQRGITRVDTVIVSHADADHFAGISLLLSDPSFEVGHVYLNPDSRQTALWDDFLSVMEDAQIRGTKFSLELTDVNPGVLQCGQTQLEILGPSQFLAYRTTRGRNRQGRRLSANAMSAVVRIWAGDVPRLLLAGDIDELGYLDMIGHRPNIVAETLVFPHHGGRPGTGDPVRFATSLMGSVGARLVMFSFGRGQISESAARDCSSNTVCRARDAHRVYATFGPVCCRYSLRKIDAAAPRLQGIIRTCLLRRNDRDLT